MRKFQCYDCKHTWELPYGEGGQGIDLACPQCGSNNIHRSSKERGRGQWRGIRNGENTAGKGREWGRGWRDRRGPQDEG
jgi:predicted RNA-binding Zn-ribbon protein involved in translation (DUF1610 family)